VALGALAFLPLLGNGFYKDDFTWISRAIDTLDGPRYLLRFDEHPNFRPLVSLTFLANLVFSGLNPVGYSLFNIAVHLANVALVVRLVERVTGGRRDVALAAGALFAVTLGNFGSAVVWICGRTGVLADFLGLAALATHGAWLERGRGRDLASSLACFLLALLCKESAVVLLPLMLLAAWAEGRPLRELLGARSLARHLPFAAVLTGYLLLTLAQFRSGSLLLQDEYALGPHGLTNLAEYLVRMILPLNATSLMVPVPAGVRAALKLVVPALMVLVPAAWAAVYAWRRERWVRFGILWMVLNLLPFVWFTFRTDTRYLYGPSVGYVLLVAGGIAAWRRRAVGSGGVARRARWVPRLALVLLVAAGIGMLESVILRFRANEAAQDPRLMRDLVEKFEARAHRTR
jgi:hypothetical protein